MAVHRLARAGAWILGSTFLSQLIRLASNLVLTRLLAPDAFGLIATVNTLYFAMVMVSDMGVWQSIVRSERGEDVRYLGTAWSLQWIRAVALALLILAVALALPGWISRGPSDAGVYADPRLPGMLAAFAIAALLQGAESMKLALAQRAMLTRRIATIELRAQIGGSAITIALALLTDSPWALVVGTLSYTLLRTAQTHLSLEGPRIRPCWEANAASDVFGFGKWIFASSLIGFLAAHGEKLLLGGLLTTADFGVFSIATLLLAAVVSAYSALNGQVVFAGLSEAIRESAAAARPLYAGIQRSADLTLGALAGLLAMTGEWAVRLLYDPRYIDAGWMLEVLALGLVALRYQVVEQWMFASARPQWATANNALRALALVTLVPFGMSEHGIPGAIAAVAAGQFASWPLSMVYKQRQGLWSWQSEAWWVPALGAGLAMGWVFDRAARAWMGS